MADPVKLAEILESVSKDAGVNKILKLSHLAYHKFCLGVSIKHLLKKLDYLETSGLSARNCSQVVKPSVLNQMKIFFRLSCAFLRTYCEYLFFALFFRLKNKAGRACNGWRQKRIKYILFSPPNDRHLGTIARYLNDECMHVYWPSMKFSFFSKINSQHGTNEFVINPMLSSVAIFSKMVRHLFSGAISIQYAVDRMSGKSGECIFIKRLYLLLIRQQQAKAIVEQIERLQRRVVVVLQNDFSGLPLMLAEECNKKNVKTVHLQHGTFFSDNLEFIPPLSKYMLCCSEREKNIQVQAGFNRNNIFVYGAPLQTLNDSKKDSGGALYDFDIVVLASRGESQKRNAGILKILFENYKDIKVMLRHDPAISEREKRIWENVVPDAVISKSKTLFEDIQSGKIIITFSADAMISCLGHHKKTIFCFRSIDHPHIYDFLLYRRFVKLADTPEKLIEAVNYFQDVSDDQFFSMVDDDFIDYNFGKSDFNKILEDIHNSLKTIYSIQEL